MEKKWTEQKKYSPSFARKFPKEDELSLRLIFSRGIKTADEAEKFFNPDYNRDLYDPFLMLSMDKAVERLTKAIGNNEKIVVFGDYDADGICGALIFHDFFQKIGFKNFEVYIPDRLEGYGLNQESIKNFRRSGSKVIVAIDCGISNHTEIAMAKELGMDVIVIDHHLVPPDKPDAFAIINPKQENCDYPFKFLVGGGLAFKTITALMKNFPVNSGWEKWLLDAVAIATIADMFPLIDENRALVHYGLQVLQRTRRVGLKILYQKLKLNPELITEDDVGFLIAPRINVANRMDRATTSFLLLTTNSASEAEWLASRLEEKTNERKLLVESILTDVRTMCESPTPPSLIIAGKKEWQPGVLPIAANKVREEFNRPVFLWGKGESKTIRGSARSDGMNLVELMRELPKDFFESFGGHSLSAGFSFDEKKTALFEKELNGALSRLEINNPKALETAGSQIVYEKELSIGDISWKLLKTIYRFRPFGIDNPKPIFILRNIVPENIKSFGNGGIHLQLNFRTPNNETISAIGFFMSKNSLSKIKKGSPLDLAFSLEKSNFKGYDELRMRIADIKTAD